MFILLTKISLDKGMDKYIKPLNLGGGEITRPCPYLKSVLGELSSKIGHLWLITLVCVGAVTYLSMS